MVEGLYVGEMEQRIQISEAQAFMIQMEADGNSVDSMSQCTKGHRATVETRPLQAS